MDEAGPSSSDSKPVKKKSSKVSASGKRLKKRGRKPHIDKETAPDELWTVSEKLMLLEGLKRYNEDCESISKWLETKTPSEVAQIIEEMKGTKAIRFFRQSEVKADDAPLNKWFRLVNEMVFHEHADYSEYIPVVFGLIARNEEFAPTGLKNLDWKRIYQYVAALLDDNADLPELTGMEAAVLLDLMDNVGSAAQIMDTSQQRQILDFKYQLLTKGRRDDEDKLMVFYRNAQALSNDFWNTEENDTADEQPPSARTPATDTISQNQEAKDKGECSKSTTSASQPIVLDSEPDLSSNEVPNAQERPDIVHDLTQSDGTPGGLETSHPSRAAPGDPHDQTAKPSRSDAATLEEPAPGLGATSSSRTSTTSDKPQPELAQNKSSSDSAKPYEPHHQSGKPSNNDPGIPEAHSVPAIPDESPDTAKTSNHDHAISDAPSSHTAQTSTSDNTSLKRKSPPDPVQESSTSSTAQDKEHPQQSEMETAEGEKEVSGPSRKMQRIRNRIDQQEVGLMNSVNPESSFKKPKFFTLNPLCIPASLMPIKRQKLDEG